MKISLKRRRELADMTLSALGNAFPDVSCTLDRDLPERLAIRGILSAQCTDERVNITAGELFEKYPTMEQIRDAGVDTIGDIIRPCGLYRAKSRSVIAFATAYCSRWDHRVPSDVTELMTCPGIGRKIANLIVGEIYAIPAMVVDTHCKRVMYRIGITDNTDPAKVEADICKVFQSSCWIALGHQSVALGRAYCRAARPACDTCPLSSFCLKRV